MFVVLCSLFVVCCSLFVDLRFVVCRLLLCGRHVLFVVWCLVCLCLLRIVPSSLFDAFCLLVVRRWSLFDDCRVLFVVCCLLLVACLLLFGVCCSLFGVCCLVFVVC